jgi:hypothetical protein
LQNDDVNCFCNCRSNVVFTALLQAALCAAVRAAATNAGIKDDLIMEMELGVAGLMEKERSGQQFHCCPNHRMQRPIWPLRRDTKRSTVRLQKIKPTAQDYLANKSKKTQQEKLK